MPCEKTPFQTLILSSFRVAFFAWRLFRLSAWRYFVLSSFCMASFRLFRLQKKYEPYKCFGKNPYLDLKIPKYLLYWLSDLSQFIETNYL